MKSRFAPLLASACVAALASAAQASTFVNGSFETGDLSGWTQGGGVWYGGAYPVATDYLPSGSQYSPSMTAISVTNAGFDPYTDNNLRLVYSGAHSARINDPNNNYSVSVISQQVTNYTDSVIAFAYAAVLQSSHGATDSDAFIITLKDLTTSETLYTYNLNSATAPGLFTQSSSGFYYTDWVAASVDVSARSGHDFLLSLLANDCPYGGHAGYAYLDGFGSVIGGSGTGVAGGGRLLWDGDAAGNDGNGTVDGGDGVWSVVSTNFTDSAATTNGAYSPQPGSVVFGGAPGTVTVDNTAGAVSITGMAFTVGGYVITGDPIALSGTSAIVQVGDGTPAGADYVATVNSSLTGTAGLTKTDLGTLVLNGVNSYSGGTSVTAGTVIGSSTSFGSGAIDNNGTVILDQTGSGAMSNPFSGAGNLIKRGAGTVALTGISNFSGPTTVQAGNLQVNGDLSGSSVTVQSGGTLSGIGLVGAVSALSGSTVAAGAPTGALGVSGNYDQAAGSTYQVSASSTGASSAIVTSGAATLANGAGLKLVNIGPSHLTVGTRYTVVTAGEGVSGTYTLSGDNHVSAFVDVLAHYDPTHVYLDVTQTRSLASVAGTPNEIAAAGGADIGTGALYNAVVYLQSAGEAKTAFNAISGEAHASIASAGLEDSRFLREAVLDRLNGDPSVTAGATGAWGRVFGSWGEFDSDGNAAKMQRDISGLFLGSDLVVTPTVRLGIVGGFSHSGADITARGSNLSTDDYHAGLYGQVKHAGFNLDAGVSHTLRDIKSARNVSFTGFSDRLTADYNSSVTQAYGEVSRTIPVSDASLEPFANLAYVRLQTDAFAEQGGAAATHGNATDNSVLFTTLGLRGVQVVTLGKDNVFQLSGQVGWRHAEGDTSPVSKLAFTNGGTFQVAGVPIAQDAVHVEAGVDAEVTKSVRISLSYSGQVGDGVSDHGVRASARWTF